MKINQMNKLKCCDGIDGMQSLPDECIPITVTSPPYDGIRMYEGNVNAFNFERIANELWRITKPGGVVCWHVQEQIINGSESGTSSEQRLYFRDLGFRLHHTMVVMPRTSPSQVRYGYSLPYVFILSKGRPGVINLIKDIPNKHAGVVRCFYNRHADGVIRKSHPKITHDYRARGPVWEYPTGGANTTTDKLDHPALMVEPLAHDLIVSWSNPGDLVFDPMAGAGTTLKMAMLAHRHYLGFEITQHYAEQGKHRLTKHRRKMLENLQLENAG